MMYSDEVNESTYGYIMGSRPRLLSCITWHYITTNHAVLRCLVFVSTRCSGTIGSWARSL